MDVFKPQLLLKRAVNIKAIVTLPLEEVQQQLQAQINQIDGPIATAGHARAAGDPEIQSRPAPWSCRPYNKLKTSSSGQSKEK